MSDYKGAAERGGPSQRIGDAERQAVIAALDTHREAGRLRSDEYEDRQVQAAQARTWAEVQPLFADLPEPYPVGMPRAATSGIEPVAGPTPGTSLQPASGGLVPEPYRSTVMALTPFAALLLALTTHIWWWFLAIPVMGILLYGAEGNQERKRQERSERERRRNERRRR